MIPKDLTLGYIVGSRCIAAAGSVTIMIPMDTVKTRLVTQSAISSLKYNGIVNCFTRMLREEGLGSLYNSLTPRLVSVVPMIGVQYLVYEVCAAITVPGPGGEGGGPLLGAMLYDKERHDVVEKSGLQRDGATMRQWVVYCKTTSFDWVSCRRCLDGANVPS